MSTAAASFRSFLILTACLLPIARATAQEEGATPKSAKELLARYNPSEGVAKLGEVAEVKLTEGWLFLSGPGGRRFLTELGNHPGPEILGVAIPPDFLESESFAVFSHVADGYVDDDEAPDYDQLLADMKENARAQSAERKKLGEGGVELLGWAEPPHYDKAQHKLYWAEKLQFEGNEGLTLNYNVRILGRSGHLVVNGVGGIEQLELVAEQNKHLLAVTDFVAGQRYEDFDPSYDKVAAYGIGGLIAGKLALKVGLFAKLALFLKAFIKPILFGLLVVGAAVARLFSGRKKKDAAAGA
jgi:uncharacterized membrane-anchored protein